MKLITFQSMEALKDLINKGYLECREDCINLKKAGPTYMWVLEKMNQNVEKRTNVKYPIWCWVKCYNNICPTKHKGQPVEGFDVKITFHKPEKEVFVTDFRRYSFLLNNMYIPTSLEDKKIFDRELEKHNITKEELKAYVRPDKFSTHRTDKEFLDVCLKIRKSFDRCITTESDILQGCVWRIDISEVEKIELLHDKDYRFGSLNYKRSDGKTMDWREDFYKKLS